MFLEGLWETDSEYDRIDNEIDKIKKEIKFIQESNHANKNIETLVEEKLSENGFIDSSNNLIIHSESKFDSDENILSIKNSGQTSFNSELLNIEKKEIGLAGELFILNYEKEFLTKNGRIDLANKVKHASLEIGDGLGYDIISYNLNGDIKYIEVKTTKGSVNTSFFISKNELNFFSTQTNAFIYRVYEFNKEEKKGQLSVIGNNEELLNKNIVIPSNYVVTPKK